MRKSIFSILTILLTLVAFAQVPQNMSYQSVIRYASDELVSNTVVGMQISILQGSASGTTVYTEVHAPTTNANGLASLDIGAGTPVIGMMETIDWAVGPYFIKSEVDPTGGTNYTLSIISELLSVPYALHAETSADNHWAENVSGINTAGNDVGINSEFPEHTLDVRSTSQADAAQLNVSNDDKSRYVRLFSGSETFPDPSLSWAPLQSLLFATYDDATFDFQEKMRIASSGDVGIGITDPKARLDIRGGDWNLDAGNPGDLRIGNETNNFRVGIATGGGGAGITRLYTNSNALILGANDTPSLLLEPNGEIKAPSMTNDLIESGGDKALVTKEYLEANGAAIKLKSFLNVEDLMNFVEHDLALDSAVYNFGGGTYDNTTGEYTIPKTGVYSITANLRMSFVNTVVHEMVLSLDLFVNDVLAEQSSIQGGSPINSGYNSEFSYTHHLSLSAGDVLRIKILPVWGTSLPAPLLRQFSTISITKVY